MPCDQLVEKKPAVEIALHKIADSDDSQRMPFAERRLAMRAAQLAFGKLVRVGPVSEVLNVETALS